MSRTKVLENVKLTSFDDLFGGNKIEKATEAGDVKEIPLSELHEFHNHPFQIRSDEELAEMIESIREHGVLVPGIVRKRKEGGYEIIAGHTRKHVCEILGFETMPVFVKEMDDDEASLVMVDSNIQRENIRPSEKAKAYKIKYDAMKNQGKAGNSLKMMSEESGENYKMIQRYIWLARLNDDLLALVDNKQLGMVQGVSLSVLPEKEQEAVYDAICRQKMKLSTVQANAIKQLSIDGKLNEQILERYLTSAQKQKRKKEITLKNERLSEYFEEETTEEEMMNIIFELLETWKRKKGSA
jgi:ParB family chromosome partitioning protein